MTLSLNESSPLSPPPGFSIGGIMDSILLQDVLELIATDYTYKWTDIDGSITRKTINYGWDFATMEFGKYIFNPLPPAIERARKAIFDSLSESIPPNLSPQQFDNIIISIYKSGQHLMPHYDADDSPNPITKRSFSFGEPILGCVIKADTESAFTFYHHTEKDRPLINDNYIYKVPEVDGCTFLINKECRHFPYFHAIPPVKDLRISMTIRQTILPKDCQTT